MNTDKSSNVFDRINEVHKKKLSIETHHQKKRLRDKYKTLIDQCINLHGKIDYVNHRD